MEFTKHFCISTFKRPQFQLPFLIWCSSFCPIEACGVYAASGDSQYIINESITHYYKFHCASLEHGPIHNVDNHWTPNYHKASSDSSCASLLHGSCTKWWPFLNLKSHITVEDTKILCVHSTDANKLSTSCFLSSYESWNF